jgi:hypothetical protein
MPGVNFQASLSVHAPSAVEAARAAGERASKLRSRIAFTQSLPKVLKRKG